MYSKTLSRVCSRKGRDQQCVFNLYLRDTHAYMPLINDTSVAVFGVCFLFSFSHAESLLYLFTMKLRDSRDGFFVESYIRSFDARRNG